MNALIKLNLYADGSVSSLPGYMSEQLFISTPKAKGDIVMVSVVGASVRHTFVRSITAKVFKGFCWNHKMIKDVEGKCKKLTPYF